MAVEQARNIGFTAVAGGGNSASAALQARTKWSPQPLPLIASIGSVPLKYIDPITHLAFPSKGALDPANPSQPPMDRPFAGLITLKSRLDDTGVSGPVHYQYQYAPAGSNAWLPASQPTASCDAGSKSKTLRLVDGGPSKRSDGANHGRPAAQANPVLAAVWDTESLSGTYDIRLAYSTSDPALKPVNTFYSETATIVVDNDSFSSPLDAAPAIDPAYDLDIAVSGPGNLTGPAIVHGDTIRGRLRARDEHFWKWTLTVEPANPLNGSTTTLCHTYGSLADKGPHDFLWRLSPLENGGRLAPGQYTLTLRAYDRAIVNSNPTLVHQGHKSVGFCVAAELQEPFRSHL